MLHLRKLRWVIHKYLIKNYSYSNKHTIFALSSGQGKCGVAVIRISGANSSEALKSITLLKSLPKPRYAVLSSIKNTITGEIIDKGLVLWFPGPRSFTGEDSFELQVHGGLAVVNSILHSLSAIPSLKLAEPGEFTKRAFFNGKLDLTEVEGLADLLQAETEAQRKQAFLQSQGSLSKLYNKWRTVLLRSVAHIEAHIDFEETETIDTDIIKKTAIEIGLLAKEICDHLKDGRKGEILRNGVKTVILGEPNVGKSSLLNLLCQRPAAIVTPIEGTTRDILEVTLNINGYPLVLIDTAGLRTCTNDIVEKEGIVRALQTYKTANLIILVIDSKKIKNYIKNNPEKSVLTYVKEYVATLNLLELINNNANNFESLFTKPCIVVSNKTDLLLPSENGISCEILKLSCKTEDGVGRLIEEITQKIKYLCAEPSEESPSMNQLRHRQHLTDCLYYLNAFLEQVSENKPLSLDTVIMAEYLRKSLVHLGKLVGSVTTDQLLDVIFKDFCIGK